MTKKKDELNKVSETQRENMSKAQKKRYSK